MNNNNKTVAVIGAIAVIGIMGVVTTTLIKKDKIKLSKPKTIGTIKHY